MSKRPSEISTALEAVVVAILALGLYLPFLAIQYDTNGIAEAVALEAGQLVNKNHVLYRPIGLFIYRTLQFAGYDGNSLTVLQSMNAICGAIGVGLAYALFKSAAKERAAAVIGAVWLATSFTYWIFSTDVAYITLAGMFGLAAMVCIAYTQSSAGIVAAGVFTSLSILTWQASLFLIPAVLLLLIASEKPPVLRRAGVFITIVAAAISTAYLVIAFVSRGLMGPRALWTWFTNYSDGGSPLPLWGVWNAGRIETALHSGLGSIVPERLAVWPGEITRSTQLGRIAVDFAFVALLVLMILAILKFRVNSLWFLIGYALFVPFIVWWDPFEPKWFFVPNIFLAGFLSCGLQQWLRQNRTGAVVIACILAIAGANFVTTIRPRHKNLGPGRTIASCVAEHMQAGDAFIAAEWGWADYLGYLHARTALNLINETAHYGTKERMLPALRDFIASVRARSDNVYMLDPHTYPQTHLDWLRAQTGLTVEDILAFGGGRAFECSGETINKLP